MNGITQDMKFRQSLMNYAKKYGGAERAENTINHVHIYISGWKRWDGSGVLAKLALTTSSSQ